MTQEREKYAEGNCSLLFCVKHVKSAELSCWSHSSPFSCARVGSGDDGRTDLVLCEQFWAQKTKRVCGQWGTFWNLLLIYTTSECRMVLWHISAVLAFHLQAANALIYSHAVKNVCIFCVHKSCVMRGGSSLESIPYPADVWAFQPAGSRQTYIIGSASNSSLVLAQCGNNCSGVL